jgi:hypothetical protein
MFNKGIELLKKAATMEKAVVDELSDAGKGLYEQNFTKRQQQSSKSLPQIRNLKIICLTILFRKFIVF